MEKISQNDQRKAPTFSVRHLQCILIFLGLSVAYMMRVNLSVAIVAMMDRNATNPDFEEYDWSEQTKSLILSGFFWGYFVTQIPGGQLAQKFGGKVMLTGSVIISGVISLLTPLGTKIGDWKLLFVLRVLTGLCQGCMFPSTHTLLSKWVPAQERGALGTFCYTGVQFGTVVMMSVSGILASSTFGWPGIFYLPGILSVIWVIVWYFLGASTPADCKWISIEERLLIEKSFVSSTHPEEPATTPKTPWRAILTSVPFWVLLVAQSSFAWGFWTLLTQIPSYMKSVLGKDIKSNAVFSALPYLVNMLLTVVFCVVADLMTRRNWCSINTSRKIFNSIGLWMPVVPLIVLSYLNADQSDLAVGLLVICIGFNSASYLGFLVNHIDLSPNFAGILMGIINCVANMMSIMAPLIVGFIVTDATNPNQWRIIFFIAAGFYFIGNLLFVLFGQTRVQSWNNPKQSTGQALREHIKFGPLELQKPA